MLLIIIKLLKFSRSFVLSADDSKPLSAKSKKDSSRTKYLFSCLRIFNMPITSLYGIKFPDGLSGFIKIIPSLLLAILRRSFFPYLKPLVDGIWTSALVNLAVYSSKVGLKIASLIFSEEVKILISSAPPFQLQYS